MNEPLRIDCGPVNYKYVQKKLSLNPCFEVTKTLGLKRVSISTKRKKIDSLLKNLDFKLVQFQNYYDDTLYVIAESKNSYFYMLWSFTSVEIFVSSTTYKVCVLLLKKIKDFFKDLREETDENNVVIDVLSYKRENGSIHTETKKILCPKYEDIKHNYPPEIIEEIDNILPLENQIDFGKLIFLLGPPGTGKTFLIRSLIRESADKFRVQLILDPENLFKEVNYLKYVLNHTPSKKNLVIIEDSPRAVLTESRETDSYSIGKFLNMTDGILGQGSESLFLLSTNDDIKDIDPAFTRRGRCISRTKFRNFTKEEGMEWLESQGVDDVDFNEYDLEGSDEVSLADLYAILNGSNIKIKNLKKDVGFLV